MEPIFNEKVTENETCGSREQYMGPIGMHYSHEKINNHGLKKKRQKRQMQLINAESKRHL